MLMVKTELGNNFNVKIKIQEPLKFSNHTSGGNSIHHISYSLPTNQLTAKNKFKLPNYQLELISNTTNLNATSINLFAGFGVGEELLTIYTKLKRSVYSDNERHS